MTAVSTATRGEEPGGAAPDAQSNIEQVMPFIDGALKPSEGPTDVTVFDPSTGRARASIPSGRAGDVDRAVSSCRAAFGRGAWSDAPPSVRKGVLHRLADIIAKNASDLDALDAGEMGKPVGEALFSAASGAGLVRFAAEAVDKVTGDVYGSDSRSVVAQRHVPRGVVAAVVPWNFPTFNALLKVAPALAAGNSVVLKPSELSSRSAIRLAQLATEAGLPEGVFNVVPGLGETVGQALGMHMDVDMVAFTGSTAIGKQMLQYAGRSNMKKVLAECGGKSPHIVFADGVDCDAVADWIAGFILINQGQICSVGSRLLVERCIEERVVARVKARFEGIKMGNALDPRTTFGPLASAAQCKHVMEYIDSGLTEGAELLAGGRRALVDSGGNYVEPTLMRGVSPHARIAQDEIFGPVLVVIPFETEEEAVRIANATMYGLIAYLWTASLSRGMRLAKAIRSSVLVNSAPPAGEGAGYACALEPFGQSGLGVEGGVAGLESYLRRQLIWINHG